MDSQIIAINSFLFNCRYKSNGYVNITDRCLLLRVVDAADITKKCVIDRYVICAHCNMLIADVDNLDDHVCEVAVATAAVSDGDGEVVVESSVKGYQCDYCHKTFAQVTCHSSCQL